MMETLALLIHPPQVQLDRYLSGRPRVRSCARHAQSRPMPSATAMRKRFDSQFRHSFWDVTGSIRLTKSHGSFAAVEL
jgi:hypothetical protein